MAGYLFFPPADMRLDDIWEYSEDKHGTKQAETYMIGLHNHLQELSEKKKLWKPIPKNLAVPADLNIQAYVSKYEYHFIFFREFPSGKIGVMSILHESMNVPVRLKEDLDKILR